MSEHEIIGLCIAELKSLFEKDGQLRGFDDWDRLIGIVMTLEKVQKMLESKKASEEESDG